MVFNQKYILLLFTVIIIVSSCETQSFHDQIINDIESKIPSGICPEFPKETKLSNIEIGEIVHIGLEGMTDVSFEFDYKIEGETIKHRKSVLLYMRKGNKYTLAEIGINCDFKKE